MATADPWAQFVNTLAAFLHVSDASQLQIPAITQPLQWNDPTYGQYHAWRNFANLIPKWDDTYEPVVGSEIDDAYRQFLWSLEVPLTDPSLQAQANEVSQQIADVGKEQTRLT